MLVRALTVVATLGLFSVVGFVASRALVPRAVGTDELLLFDKGMFSVTLATGGDFYFWEPGEFATADLRLPLGGEDVVLAYPVLDGRRDFPFPIDSLVSRVEIFASAQELHDVRLLTPAGRMLDGDLPRVDVQSYQHLFLATIQNPDPGAWRIEVEGRGQLSLSVRVGTDRRTLPPGSSLTSILLVDFELTELRGRPGHEGFFELQEAPAAGTEHPARVRLAGSFATAELGLIDNGGEPLDGHEPVPLEFKNGNTAQLPFVVPDTPYRVLVRGRDFTGLPFQRVLGALHRPARRP